MERINDEGLNDSNKSEIFTESIPIYGKVSMLFYIPETLKDRDTIVQLIRENGGNTVNFHECFTYQLGPQDSLNQYSFYQGDVISLKWIFDSVEKGELIDHSQYKLGSHKSGIDFPFNKKKIQYTGREIIKIYEWISGRKSQASRKTWESLSNEGIVYCRSKESLKNFWKKWRSKTVDECLTKMIESKIKYCHNYTDSIMPHHSLPEPKVKNGKRNREALKYEPFEEDEGENEVDDKVKPKKRMHKRKLKKKESEGVKLDDSESAGNQFDGDLSDK